MGEVYRADDLKLGQPVALKFLPRQLAGDRDRLERFYAEVRIARQVSHPNVCRVYDVGEIDGQHYLSMEYVDGEDLGSLLKRIGRLPPDKALDIARELCAGLSAAHDKGVLHRDLKPSNVMIDGRGRARITDFGLAVAAGEVIEGEVSGTPAYMAPEQLAGKGASVRSDVYALGLVLYELSTGRKAFDGATLAELRRKHAEEPPTPPSVIAPGFDPAVERVILRCLSKEPSARPASAAHVAKALPGGDPLAAALAAGETPSPEMVAAAGAEGALAPAKAWAMLGATVVLLAAVLGLARFSMDQGLAPFPKSPEFLEERARELIKSFGYTVEPADEASWWERQGDYMSYRAAHEPSTKWRASLARTEPHPWLFWHRQSPRPMVPQKSFFLIPDTPIRATDPPLEVSGMLSLALDARGNLMRLRAVPPQVETPDASPSAPDWKPLFVAAGLDLLRFQPSAPRWLPLEPFDVRADWDGAYASGPNMPIHVSAAAWRGRPVSFEILGPWSVPERMPEQPQAAVLANYAFLFFILSSHIAAVLLARRNLRLGRGDRRGAFRIAAFVSVTVVLWWLFWAHHVPTQDEGWNLMTFVALAVYLGAFVWLAYIAIEPIVRSRWPELLFSLSRLLSGRFRDPLVGRDVLAGILVGAALVLLNEVVNAIPNWVDLAGVTPIPPDKDKMLGVAGSVSRLLIGLVSQVTALAFLTLLVLSLVLLRRRWLAIGLTGLLLVVTNLFGENYAVEIPAAIIASVVLLYAVVRFGVLAYIVSQFVYQVLAFSPLTLDLSRWYAARGLAFVALILALAVWAFRVSLGGRPAFAGARLEDAPER